MNQPCSCIICKKQFSHMGINSHYITAHTVEGNNRVKLSAAKGSIKGGQAYKINIQKITELNKQNYLINPKLCKHCNSIIPYEKRGNNFCNRSCSASYNNVDRDTTKLKTTWNNKRQTSETTGKVKKPISIKKSKPKVKNNTKYQEN